MTSFSIFQIFVHYFYLIWSINLMTTNSHRNSWIFSHYYAAIIVIIYLSVCLSHIYFYRHMPETILAWQCGWCSPNWRFVTSWHSSVCSSKRARHEIYIFLNLSILRKLVTLFALIPIPFCYFFLHAFAVISSPTEEAEKKIQKEISWNRPQRTASAYQSISHVEAVLSPSNSSNQSVDRIHLLCAPHTNPHLHGYSFFHSAFISAYVTVELKQ